jgi:hypothetical protein
MRSVASVIALYRRDGGNAQHVIETDDGAHYLLSRFRLAQSIPERPTENAVFTEYPAFFNTLKTALVAVCNRGTDEALVGIEAGLRAERDVENRADDLDHEIVAKAFGGAVPRLLLRCLPPSEDHQRHVVQGVLISIHDVLRCDWFSARSPNRPGALAGIYRFNTGAGYGAFL